MRGRRPGIRLQDHLMTSNSSDNSRLHPFWHNSMGVDGQLQLDLNQISTRFPTKKSDFNQISTRFPTKKSDLNQISTRFPTKKSDLNQISTRFPTKKSDLNQIPDFQQKNKAVSANINFHFDAPVLATAAAQSPKPTSNQKAMAATWPLRQVRKHSCAWRNMEKLGLQLESFWLKYVEIEVVQMCL